MEILDLILEYNYFRYEDIFYVQVKEVTMGSVVALSLSNVFIANLESTVLHNSENSPF